MGLRIAFFGSDRFSIASLKSLLQLQRTNRNVILSLDVITRRIKPTGKRLDQYVDLPVGEFATTHQINIVRADTKQEIVDLGKLYNFDLAVAVSYGGLIPREFLNSLTYGGINVHPSLLPRYCGASPIQYALMNDDHQTGVTVQTLHPTKFDKGDILLQSPAVAICDDDNYQSLETKLGDIGGELLTNVILSQLYLHKPNFTSPYRYSHAFKLHHKDSVISWDLPSRKIRRLFDAMGNLNTFIYCLPHKKKPGQLRSVKLHDIKENYSDIVPGDVGEFKLSDNNTVLIKTIDGAIEVSNLTFQTFNCEDAETFMKRLDKRTHKGHRQFINSSQPL